jgi:diacylglycerol kinase family enzyme
MSKNLPQPKRLSCLVVINRRSGTVRSRGAEKIRDLVELALADIFHPLTVQLVDGDVLPDIEAALKTGDTDVIIAGGGDGTISSAAQLVLQHGAILGALPLGTMNLFVRAIGFSSVLEEALQQLKQAQVQSVDVGVVNDKLFLHQVSLAYSLVWRACVNAWVIAAASPKCCLACAHLQRLPCHLAPCA